MGQALGNAVILALAGFLVFQWWKAGKTGKISMRGGTFKRKDWPVSFEITRWLNLVLAVVLIGASIKAMMSD